MKHPWLCGALLVWPSLAWSAPRRPRPAPAPPAARPAPVRPQPTPARPQPARSQPVPAVAPREAAQRESRIEFDERLVQGQTAAGAIYLFQRGEGELRTMVRVPESFKDRTIRQVYPETTEGQSKR